MKTPANRVALGMLLCWCLNTAQLGIGWLLLVRDERNLAPVYVLIGAIGIVQVGYVAPLYRYFRTRGLSRMAKGVLIAASTTVFLNAGFLGALWGKHMAQR